MPLSTQLELELELELSDDAAQALKRLSVVCAEGAELVVVELSETLKEPPVPTGTAYFVTVVVSVVSAWERAERRRRMDAVRW